MVFYRSNLRKRKTAKKRFSDKEIGCHRSLSQWCYSFLYLTHVGIEERPAFKSERYRKSELLGKHNLIQFYFNLYIYMTLIHEIHSSNHLFCRLNFILTLSEPWRTSRREKEVSSDFIKQGKSDLPRTECSPVGRKRKCFVIKLANARSIFHKIVIYELSRTRYKSFVVSFHLAGRRLLEVKTRMAT